jgi:hypothetical protein
MEGADVTSTTIERADALAQVNDWIAEAVTTGEVEDGVVPDYLAELLADAEKPFREKLERTGLAALRREQQADAITAEIKRLQQRKQSFDREAERIRQYAKLCLEIAHETKVDGTMCTVALQLNPPSVRDFLTPSQICELYEAEESPFVKKSTTYALDKKLILDAHKQGRRIPEGVTVERSTSLRIR